MSASPVITRPRDRPLILPMIAVPDEHQVKRDYIKYVSMGVLVIQNSSLVLMMGYSRKKEEGVPMYYATSCIFLMEIVKLVCCLFLCLIEKGNMSDFLRSVYVAIVASPIETFKMFIPAFIYTVQNIFLFVALSNLHPSVYQVTYQLKILTTALFSVLLLGKQLQLKQWFSLVLLMVGVTFVQLELQGKSKDNRGDANPALGLVAVVSACFLSGFAGVYFERIVKKAEANIWIRNIQLGIFSATFSFIAMIYHDGQNISENGLLYGYNFLVWMVVLLQAAGGLLVAIVVKYADNILKGFATSISIVLSSIISFYITGNIPSIQYLLGTLVVLSSVYMYSSG